MARVNLDPRTGGACFQCMSNKLVNVGLGYLQLVAYILGFLTLVFRPSLVSSVIPDANAAALVFLGFFLLLFIMFIVLLLLGLHKDKRVFVKVYCIFMAVYIVLMVIGLFFLLGKLDFCGFFLTILSIIIYIIFVFAARSYYLVTYCNVSNQVNINQPKV